MKKKYSLLGWITGIFLTLTIVCAAVLLIFTKISMENLLDQEIENRQAILKLTVDNVDTSLSSLQSYLYQNFTGSEEITMIETGTDETKLFMAIQSLTRDLNKIVGWNDSLKFLFFYSPQSRDQVLLQVSTTDVDYLERKELERQVKEYIDGQLAEQAYLGRGYLLLRIGDEGYVIRFYKIRNNYLGMCLDSRAVLQPLEELTSEGCLAFLADVDGNIVSRTEGLQENIDIADNGKLLQKDGEQYLQLNYLSEQGDFYIGTWTKASLVNDQLKWMRNLIVVLVAGVLAVVLAFLFLIRKSLYQPIRSMEQAMKKVGDGEWDLAVKEDSHIREYSSMLHNFNEMVSEIKDLKIRNYEKELAAQKAYLQCLQLQINPHFYLNALNIIYSLAEVRDYGLIQEMTMSLVEYSRYMFRRPENLVTIAQEIEHVDNYMKIQRMRFPDEMVNPKVNPCGLTVGDFDLQVDVETKKGYLISQKPHTTIYVAELNEEYTDTLEIYSEHFPHAAPPEAREAPAHFIREGWHYLITSGTTGYYSNPSEVSRAKDWHGPYEIQGNPHVGDTSKTSFNSQITSVFRHPQKKDLYIALADRWRPELPEMAGEKWATGAFSDEIQDKFRRIFDPAVEFVFTPEDAKDMRINSSISDYVWLPLKFENGRVRIEWLDEWRIEEYD